MMDCQTCNDLLLDLAYGELDEVRAAAVRKHADACADCRRALGRIKQGRALARQLVTEEPPPVSAALRAALEAATARPAAVAAVSSIVPPANASGGGEITGRNTPARGVTRWFERVGEFAMRRQVAMAAVFVLTIGVGFIYYQSHPRPDSTPDDHVPDVVPAVEVSSGPPARQGTNVPSPTGPTRPRPTSLNAVARNVAPQPQPAPPPAALERANDDRQARLAPPSPAPSGNSNGSHAVAPSSDPAAPSNATGASEITPQHRPVAVVPNLDPNNRPDEIQPAPQTPPLGASNNTAAGRFAPQQQFAQQSPPPPPPPPPSLAEPAQRNSANTQLQFQMPSTANNNNNVRAPARGVVAPNDVARSQFAYHAANNTAQAPAEAANSNVTTPQYRAPTMDLHAQELQVRQQLSAARTPHEQDENRVRLAGILASGGRYDEAIATLRLVEASPELRTRAQAQIDALERQRLAQVERSRQAAPPARTTNANAARPPAGPSVTSRPARRAATPNESSMGTAAY